MPTPWRSKGGAPLLGATGPGQSGPFGPYDDGQDQAAADGRTPLADDQEDR